MQVCLLQAGCKQEQTPAAPAALPDAGPTPKPENSPLPQALRVQVDSIPLQINPLISQDVWCQRIALHTLFEPLVALTPNGAFAPILAERMEVSDGGRRYRFQLRQGVEFHDGRPLTSADVLYTLEKAKDPRSGLELLQLELSDIFTVEERGPQALELILRQPNYLLPAVLAEIPILPAHRHNRFGLRNAKLNEEPVGTGPFFFSRREGQSSLTLARYERYWGKKARLQELVFRAIPEPPRALSALRNGELDLLSSLYPGYYPEQVAADKIKARFQVLRLHPYRMRVLITNQKNRPFRDRRVRLALERLIDHERMIHTLRHGLAQRLSAPLWPLSKWYDSTLHPHASSRQEAGRLLEQAGWLTGKEQGPRLRQGWPFRLRVLYARSSPEMEEGSKLVKASLAEGGIFAEMEAADFGFIKARLTHRRYAGALTGLAPRPHADLSLYLHSKGKLNFSGYTNPVVDSLLDNLRGAATEESRQTIARRLHRALYDDPPFTVLYAPIELMVADRRLAGFTNDGRWPSLAALRWEEPSK